MRDTDFYILIKFMSSQLGIDSCGAQGVGFMCFTLYSGNHPIGGYPFFLRGFSKFVRKWIGQEEFLKIFRGHEFFLNICLINVT